MAGFWNAETMRRRLDAEALIDPFHAKRVVNGAYELSLGPEVYVTTRESDTKRVIEMGEQVSIPPGQFANLLTEETVKIPADALGFISVKFRLKQRGLVNVSGFHVDPGYVGQLLFSVYNAGASPVVVTRGEPAFLLWYAAFDEPTAEEDLYNGPKRDSITADDVMHLQGEIATPQALATRLAKVERRLDNWSRLLWVLVSAAVALVVGYATDLFDREAATTTTTTTTSVLTTIPPTSSTSAPTSTTAHP